MRVEIVTLMVVAFWILPIVMGRMLVARRKQRRPFPHVIHSRSKKMMEELQQLQAQSRMRAARAHAATRTYTIDAPIDNVIPLFSKDRATRSRR